MIVNKFSNSSVGFHPGFAKFSYLYSALRLSHYKAWEPGYQIREKSEEDQTNYYGYRGFHCCCLIGAAIPKKIDPKKPGSKEAEAVGM